MGSYNVVSTKNRKEIKKLSPWDFLLIIGVITAPMTSIRIWKIGIAELSIFIWSLKILLDTRFKFVLNKFVIFWLFFDFLLFLGFSFRVFKSVNTGNYMNESMTFIFFNVFIIALSQYLHYSPYKRLISLLKGIFYGSFLIYFPLYLYSIFFNESIGGFPLWYHGSRLSLLAENPHQLVFLTGPLFLLGFFLLSISKENKFIVILVVLVFLLLSFETKASTFVAVFFILVSYILFNKIGIVKEKKKRLYINIVKTSFALTLLMVFRNSIFRGVEAFLESDENGLGRVELWITGLKQIFVSPIVGLGPGSHIVNYGLTPPFSEAHNTYIDITLRSGILGLILFLALLVYSLNSTKKNIYGTSIVLFFCIYGIAGYSLRRITLWFFIMIIVYICEKKSSKYKVFDGKSKIERMI